MKPWTTKKLRNLKKIGDQKISMLTCYDFQTAQMLEDSNVDLILVGDSLGNVILGHDTTVSVTIEDMITFGAAVKRGAPSKFTVIDLPFGTYATKELAIKNGLKLFQKTKAESLKLEGISDEITQSIKLLTNAGVPIMGHIGLTPQSVHEQGGYFTHGKTTIEEEKILRQAQELEEAGVFAIVLECVTETLAEKIDQTLSIPTIGIGSGPKTTGQVLVLNDLLGLGKNAPPGFCKPVSNLFNEKLKLTNSYIKSVNQSKELTQ